MDDKKENLTLFKTRVVNIAKDSVINYQVNSVDYDYLLCSETFIKNKYYIINAHKDNLSELLSVLKYDLFAEEDFEKNSVICHFGISNSTFY